MSQIDRRAFLAAAGASAAVPFAACAQDGAAWSARAPLPWAAGKNYREQFEAVLPVLRPWLDRFGYAE